MISHIYPPAGTTRALYFQTLLDACGQGFFLAGSALFLTGYAHLSLAQIGLGVSAGVAASLIVALPAGWCVDRYEAQRIWWLASLVEALSFCGYLLVTDVPGYLVVVVLASTVAAVGTAARQRYTFAALAQSSNRVEGLAYIRTALNIGFAGSGLLFAALTVGAERNALIALPLVAAGVKIANAYYVRRLATIATPAPDEAAEEVTAQPDRAYRAWPFVVLALLNGVLLTDATLLNFVLPVWIVTQTSAPATMVPLLFVLNTVVVVALQVVFSRGASNLSGATRATRQGAYLVAAASVLAFVAGHAGVATIILLLLALFTVLSLGEIRLAAGDWGLLSSLAPASRLGAYQAVWRIGATAPSLLAPVAFGFLVEKLAIGWLLIAATFVLFSVLLAVTLRHPGLKPSTVDVSDEGVTS